MTKKIKRKNRNSKPGPSPSYYRRLEREEVSPYFPSAFAVDPSSPLDFNFELFLLDSLSLPCAIQKQGDTVPAIDAVTFETPERAIEYCTEKIKQAWRATLPLNYQPQPADNSTKEPSSREMEGPLQRH